MKQEMQYIYQVYQSGSFSKAAQALYLTQPALSIAIQKVEAEIGMPLFIRDKKPLELTDAGKVYIEKVKEILHLPGETNEELIAALVQKIRDLNDQLNIPQSIKDYANGGVKVDAENPQMVSEEEFLAKLPEIAANAEQDACTPENPRETKAADFEKILKACYYDTDIDF